MALTYMYIYTPSFEDNQVNVTLETRDVAIQVDSYPDNSSKLGPSLKPVLTSTPIKQLQQQCSFLNDSNDSSCSDSDLFEPSSLDTTTL